MKHEFECDCCFDAGIWVVPDEDPQFCRAYCDAHLPEEYAWMRLIDERQGDTE